RPRPPRSPPFPYTTLFRSPPSLSKTQVQYVGAMALYANAAAEMLKFTEDSDRQRLGVAHEMDVRASEDMLRVGEVLWPTRSMSRSEEHTSELQSRENLVCR